ncbi:DUF4129 domain-containing transglutaminase family protein [Paenibacillus macerans]|uniref:DUF4129 domain-containing transglutaminase family protein n=1 Tax=Paenibacillus macerans TaxID=44252 RepID=UPI003D31B05F
MPVPNLGTTGESSSNAAVLGRRNGQAALSAGRRIVISLLLFGLFGEWLYPLNALIQGGQTEIISLFFVLTGALLLLGCLRVPSGLFALLPPLLIAGSMLYLYGEDGGLSWFSAYAQMLGADLQEFLASGRLYGISMETRALLLLIGWTLLVVSVHMLALGRQSILLFLSATIVYLLALEAAAGLELYLGVIRSAALGLLLQATAFYRSEPGPNRGIGAVAGSGIVLACVAGAALLSSLLPLQPVRAIPWEQVVRSLSDWSGADLANEPGSAAAFSVSGYGHDDTKLGAPLRLRHDPYFTALSPYNTYWRGESKSVYTGRGWMQPAGAEPAGSEEVPALAGEDSSGDAADKGENGKELIRQTVMFKEPLTGRVALLSGGLPVETERIIAGDRTHPVQLDPRYDALADAFVIDYAAPAEQIYGYELTAEVQASSALALQNAQGSDPADITGRFLQLPDSLPSRVRELGKQLVAGESSRYDAAKAVETYLKHRYAYSLDSKVPPEGSDFVDRFLFVDKIGYCDHFSTAMVILLRSGGIPARWVKGFAPGDPAPAGGSGLDEAAAGSGIGIVETAVGGSETEPEAALKRYTVTYADAHSWVEVYFPEVGWVPFDPTPGYGETIAAGIGSLPGGESGAAPESAFPMLAKVKEVAELLKPELSAMAADWWAKRRAGMNPVVWTAWALAAGFAFIVLRELKQRGDSIQLGLYLLMTRRRFPGRRELLFAADRVWRELALVYGPKPPDMTAREYVQAAFREKPGLAESAEEFVRIWETVYYGGLRTERTDSMNFLKQCRKLALLRR